MPNSYNRRECIQFSAKPEAVVDTLAPDQDREDSVLDFESSDDDHTKTIGGRGRGERSTTKVVGQVCGGDWDPNWRGSCMWLRTFDTAKAYERATFKLHDSKAIFSFPLEVEKYETVDMIKKLKKEKVTKSTGDAISYLKNMQRPFGTPTDMVFFNIHPFTSHFSQIHISNN
ncbi:hypothetical protein TIFTF001_009855 [Ficus carica]|uniref:Uncharacterized protein n=1 Tax=Ficus carica TaxID=3494 RepID=A0AA88CZA8_FICCA|nr:hypothetical protein TIFTF001_009855 [Ficus carica]